MTFLDLLKAAQVQNESMLCVGLDPDMAKLPAHLPKNRQAVFDFCASIVDFTADLVCSFKPQIAYFAAMGAEAELERLVRHIRDVAPQVPVILDAKRGDVGSTSDFYAREAFDVYGADAVTVNPYLGGDSLEPFLERADKGVILLCRTSNPGGADLQNLKLASGEELYEYVAQLAATQWNSRGNIGLVVGATRPAELKRVREITGNMTFLLPGIGAQGGDVAASLEAGRGGGLIVSSSRAVLYPDSEAPGAVRAAAMATRDLINEHRG